MNLERKKEKNKDQRSKNWSCWICIGESMAKGEEKEEKERAIGRRRRKREKEEKEEEKKKKREKLSIWKLRSQKSTNLQEKTVSGLVFLFVLV